jgi:RNA polymerase sigma-70 factor, ECF subfamily
MAAALENPSVSTRRLDLADAVARAQVGDQAAFDAIYYHYAGVLFRYLYERCGSTVLAEELHGDLWVRVVERLPKFCFPRGCPEAAFAAWLYRIARNLVIDHARRKGNQNLPLAETLSAQDASPDEQVIAGDERRVLRSALEQLTVEQREVLLLRFFEERSNAEVALLTGRSENAVRVMQHRALSALARILGGWKGQGRS